MASRGFTLLELLIALGISALLLALTVPTLQRQRAQVALRTAASQTVSTLHLARRLALARGQTITVCPSTDGFRCAFDGSEWLLFANNPGGSEARREADEPLLRRWELAPAVRVSGTRGYAAFHSRPGAAATVTFRFAHHTVAVPERSVVVSQTGRPRLATP